MTLIRWLDHFDRILSVLIQHDSDHAVMDGIMLAVRNPNTWIPLYLLMGWYALRKGSRFAWPFILLSILSFALTDSLTAQILKPLFGRLRPCYDPEMQGMIRGLVDCGGAFSMPSNHAANHFGLAAFWYFSIGSASGRKWKILWVWAAIVCYAQVYVGKHYPFDVFVGAVTGLLAGWGMFRLFVYWQTRQGDRSMLKQRPPFKKSAEI